MREVGAAVEQRLEGLVVALQLDEQVGAEAPGLELAGHEATGLAVDGETLDVLLVARVLEGDAAIELPGLEELAVDGEHRREAQRRFAVVRVLDEELAIEADRRAVLALVAGAVRIAPKLVFTVAAALQGLGQLNFSRARSKLLSDRWSGSGRE
jgi:hypothetical protein